MQRKQRKIRSPVTLTLRESHDSPVRLQATELPEALGSQLGALQMLNLRGCTALNQLPSWVNEMEKNGVAVMRPFHLE